MVNSREATIYSKRYQQLIAGLVRLRKKKNISQEELAERLGLARVAVSKVETCDRRLDVAEFSDWLAALGLERDLLGGILKKL